MSIRQRRPLCTEPLVGVLASLLIAVGCGGSHSSTPSGAAADGGVAAADGGAPAKGSWTMLGFDLGSTYNNPYETKLTVANAKNLTEAWSLKTVGSVTGVPCIIGNDAYVVSQGKTYKLDLGTGKPVWSVAVGIGTSSPSCTLDTIYVQDSRGNLVSLRSKDGKMNWMSRVDPHPKVNGFSSAIVAGDKVLVGTSSTEETSVTSGATFRGSVVAFDVKDGSELWRTYTAEKGFTGATIWSTVSVSLEDKMVFAGTGNNYTGSGSDLSDSIVAMDLETGEILWHRQFTTGDVFTTLNSMGNPDNDFGANPILFEAKVNGKLTKLVGGPQKSGMFWALDRMTGKDIWSVMVSNGNAGTGGMLNNGAFDGERILLAGNTGTSKGAGSEPSVGGFTSRLIALEAGTGKIVWERQLPALVWAPITVANGVGFVSADKDIQAFNTKTGEKLFSFSTKGTIGSGAAVVDGHVLFGSGFTYTQQVTRDTTFHALVVK